MKIIWAMDPYQHAGAIEAKCAETITSLQHGDESFSVEPVYVVPPGAYYKPFELIYTPSYPLKEEALREMRSRLGRYVIPGLLPPVVIQEPVAYLRGAVRALCGYAVDRGGDLIVAGTHGRRGMARFFLGSFAETLTLYSRVPTLLIRAETEPVKKLKRILLPIEVEAFPEDAFSQACELARRFDGKLYLLHAHPAYLILITDEKLAAEARMQERVEVEKKRQKLETHVTDAAKRGVKAEVMIAQSNHSVGETILDYVSHLGIELVVMEARSGAVRSALAGSSTRQVVRGATCPVWVLRSRGVIARTKKAA